MIVEMIEIPYSQIKKDIRSNIASYYEPIDSYYEDHIIESRHFEILLDNQKCGYCSVFEDTLLTQFSILDKFKDKAQGIFHEVLMQREIKEAYLSTSDKLLLILALDMQKEVEVQDYIFQPGGEIECRRDFFLRKAVENDIPGIKKTDEGFFKNLEKNVASEELFIGLNGNTIVSYGIIEKSKMFDDLASIGMFVLKNERGNGYGALTIINLIKHCDSSNIRPVAGCFVKNEYSVNALKKAGMISMNRLLKVKLL
jgi:hypothetical protein